MPSISQTNAPLSIEPTTCDACNWCAFSLLTKGDGEDVMNLDGLLDNGLGGYSGDAAAPAVDGAPVIPGDVEFGGDPESSGGDPPEDLSDIAR